MRASYFGVDAPAFAAAESVTPDVIVAVALALADLLVEDGAPHVDLERFGSAGAAEPPATPPLLVATVAAAVAAAAIARKAS
jgi:malic enzyme